MRRVKMEEPHDISVAHRADGKCLVEFTQFHEAEPTHRIRLVLTRWDIGYLVRLLKEQYADIEKAEADKLRGLFT